MLPGAKCASQLSLETPPICERVSRGAFLLGKVKLQKRQANGMVGFIFTGDSAPDECGPSLDTATSIKNQGCHRESSNICVLLFCFFMTFSPLSTGGWGIFNW